MTGVEILLNGFRKFRETYYEKAPEIYRDLWRNGQRPRFAVVACSDSRVDPAIVLQTEPGEIFAVRNVAALVPPYEEAGAYHGTSAALEFAIDGLHVEHVIVIGHAHCGGVEAMVRNQEPGPSTGGMFITAWTDLLRKARERALAVDSTLSGDDLVDASGRQAVRLSLENLDTFPFIRKAVAENRVSLHGWYLNIFDGKLEIWNPEHNVFESQH
ncbi:MAG: carbonic anhydrase [Alphaproteobacteria bacterium]